MDGDTVGKLQAKYVLAAAARHDVGALKTLLRDASANAQLEAGGSAPLHAAVEACVEVTNGEPSSNSQSNGDVSAVKGKETAEAIETVKLLLENGAIWNDLNANDETPGCIAYRLGLETIYQLIVEAGVAAELLLSKLDAMNTDVKEDEEEEADEEVGAGAVTATAPVLEGSGDAERQAATRVQTEPPEDYIDHWDSNAAFLRSSLRYTNTQLLDSSSNAVMMDWETQIMTRHAQTLLPEPGLRAMNIGHGMGIVDTAIQALNPAEHHIVEAHPAVLKHMRETGWFDKPGVIIHQGRWQDILPKLREENIMLDAIYYDTFAESYQDFKELFQENVANGLLDPKGRFGFYHGLGADRRVCYDVYTTVAELDLRDAFLETEWEELEVPKLDWEGVRRPYWNVDVYRLPTCKFMD